MKFNLLDAFVAFYGMLHNKRGNPIKSLFFLRYLVRWLANKFLPIYLSTNNNNNKYSGILKKNEPKIIVSMTSFPGRINTVWMVIECLLRQTRKPDMIILYLSKKQFKSLQEIPEPLKTKIGEVFHIELVDADYRSHKKYLYAFQQFSNDIVITVDDDIFYPTTMIESLIKHHRNNPHAVICRYAHKIEYDKMGKIKPYKCWENALDFKKNDFFGSGGGTLFCPKEMYKDVTDINVAIKLCPLADDVWLNAMARLNGLSIVVSARNPILPIYSETKEKLCSVNFDQNMNDVQIKNVIMFYKNKIGVNPFAKKS